MSATTEIPVRLGFFFGVLLVMALWEFAAPRRRLTVRKPLRWARNLALVALNAGLVRLVLPVTAVGAALIAESRQRGLLELVDWPLWLEVALAVVALDMHRVHHSVMRRETNRNFGFNLRWWDHLLGTYRAQPEIGHEGMTMGLRTLRDECQVERLPGMWLLPFRTPLEPTPSTRRRMRDQNDSP